MVLATKSRNTKFFFRFLAVLLSICMMAGSAFFAVRIAETFIYTDKGEKILQGIKVNGDLSESHEVTELLRSDISWMTNSLYLKDEKSIKKTLDAQKEVKLGSLIENFKKAKSSYEADLKYSYSEADEETETTSIDPENIDNHFDSDVNFEYKNMSLNFCVNDWQGTENEIFLSDSEDVAKKKLEAMFANYVSAKKYLNNVDGGYSRDSDSVTSDLKYYAKNKKNNLVLTNFDKNEKTDGVLDNRYALVIKNNIPEYSESFKNVLNNDVNPKTNEVNLTDKNIEYYIYIATETPVNNGYLEEINNYYGVMEYSVKNDVIAAAILFVLSVIAALWYFVKCGTRMKDGKVKRAFIDYMPTDMHLVLAGGAITGLVALYIPLFQAIESSVAGEENHKLFVFLAAAVAGGIWAVLIEFLSSFIRVCKSEKKIYNNLLTVIVINYIFVKPTVWLFKKAKSLLTYKPDNFKRRFTSFLILYGVINLILFIICASTGSDGNVKAPVFSAIIIIILNAAVVSFGVWYAVQLDKIITAAHYRTVPQVNYEKLPQSLKTLYNSLRYTQQELETAVSKAVRDERMRSELITNVSHDLKTPLTSIITYVDLLKTCDIEDRDAKDYLNVLDEKNNRLKRLIDDLIEASKITSGVINLNPVNLSLTELAGQAVGERNREFTENGLDLVFDGSKQISCFADGNKTFRIIENLLSNAKKYSLKGTRVYCSVYETQNVSIFDIKNTSAQPLNITPEELTERFVRGDKSRTNEGNGLGLSIADNLCRAQGGHLNITIDGDLFKAQVMLPKAK